MKKSIFSFTVLCALSLFVGGCSDGKLHNVRGLVKGVEISGDTLKSMTLSVDGEEMLFSLDEARFQRGVMLHGDSVIVDYVKGRKANRAYVVTVLPKAGMTIRLGEATSDTLVTAPAKTDEPQGTAEE